MPKGHGLAIKANEPIPLGQREAAQKHVTILACMLDYRAIPAQLGRHLSELRISNSYVHLSQFSTTERIRETCEHLRRDSYLVVIDDNDVDTLPELVREHLKELLQIANELGKIAYVPRANGAMHLFDGLTATNLCAGLSDLKEVGPVAERLAKFIAS